MADWGSLSSFQSPYLTGGAGLRQGVTDDMQHPLPSLSKDQFSALVGNLGLSDEYLGKVMVDPGGQAPGFMGGGDGNSYFPGGNADQALRDQFGAPNPVNGDPNFRRQGYVNLDGSNPGWGTAGNGNYVTYDDLQNAVRQYGMPDTWKADAPPPAAPPPTKNPPVATPNFTHLNGIPTLNSISQSPVFGSTAPNGVLDSAAGTYHSSFGALAGTGGANPQTPGNGGVPGTVDWTKWMMGNTPNGPQQF